MDRQDEVELAKLRQLNRVSQLVNTVATAANGAASEDEALQVCLEAICDHTGWPIGHVYMLSDVDEGVLDPTTLWHLDQPDSFRTFKEMTEQISFTSGNGLPGRVMQRGGPIWIVDAAQAGTLPRNKLAKVIGLHAALAFPVLIDGRVVAVLEFYSTNVIDPDEQLLEALAQIGVQLGHVFERRQADRLRATSEQRLRDFARASTDWFWEMDADGRFIYVSEQHFEATGEAQDVYLSRNAEQIDLFFSDGDSGGVARDAIAKRIPFRDVETWRVYQDGQTRWVRSNARPFFDVAGAYQGYRGLSTDITKEVTARLEAELANQRFFDAFDKSQDHICLYDSDDRLVYLNEIARQHRQGLYGQDFLGLTFEDFCRATLVQGHVPEAEGQEELWLEERMRRHRQPSHSFKVHGRGGEDYWHEIREHRMPDGGTLVTWVNVTEFVIQEQLLHQAQKMEAVGQLTGGVAHDFNNLMGVIMGNLELLLLRSGADESISSYANKALAATERGAELTHRLLAFSRTQPLRPRSVDVDVLVREMEELFVRTLGENVEIEMRGGGSGAWPCDVDPGQLENVVLNLCLNAHDAMPDGGRLTVETSNVEIDDAHANAHTHALAIEEIEIGQYLLLAISDTGVGMEDEVIAKAFDPFFTTKDVGQGSGLGLSMIHGFVKQSGGHVQIYSEVDKGTTIKIYLPRSTTIEAVISDASVQPAMDTSARGEVLMVVEDDIELRTVIVTILGDLGYRVLEAGSAASALAQLGQGENINLLISDIILPGGLGGKGLVAKATDLHPDLKSLFVSGYAENAAAHQSRLADGAALLVKPFGRRDLALKVREILDS